MKKIVLGLIILGFSAFAEDYDLDAMSKKAGYAEYMKGIMLDVANKPQEAKMWFEKASTKGFEQANVSLGLLYVKGRGVQENRNTAYKYWKKAAERGNTDAQNNLNQLCSNTPWACE